MRIMCCQHSACKSKSAQSLNHDHPECTGILALAPKQKCMSWMSYPQGIAQAGLSCP